MTPYLIFVLVLTVAYIIYYGYNISKDIYGKKNQEDITEETFDIDITNDQPVPMEVRETGDGFSLGETIVSPPVPNIIEETPDVNEPSEEQKKIENIKENLLEADVESTGGVTWDELQEMLMKQKSNVEFIKSGVKVNKTNV